MWLSGRDIQDRLMAALRPTLMNLWQEAWRDGAESAGEAAGDFRHIPDQVAADRIARLAAKWLDEVTQTRLSRIAVILAKGGTPASLEAEIRALLTSNANARMVVITEVTRAMMAAAMEVYRAAGIVKVRWVTRSHDPCPICLANEAAGPRYLGEPFPSGKTAPPEHPNCQCALIPVED